MVVSIEPPVTKTKPTPVVEREEITVRFAGDSGDGMQLVGTQMTNTSAMFGNDVSTFPDFPAEIRAPAGTLAGVSGYQLNFGARKLRTAGDTVNALIAMNPAALKTNVEDLEQGGILVINDDAFNPTNLQKAGYKENPLENGSLERYQLFRIPMEKLTAEACKDTGLTARNIARCKNFYSLGLVYWLYGKSLEPTERWLQDKFGKKADVLSANLKALRAGYYFGETTDMFSVRYLVPAAKIAPGRYRKVTGNEALAMGLITAARLANKPLFYGSYPITPASDILHELSRHKNFDVRTFQAEDEIAAITSVIGASFAGALAVTGTSGPGVALKQEAIALAIMTELPLVIVNVQRGGPSTGLPTKTEQADLHQAIWGRNGEAPCCVLAASTPADCFHMAMEAFRIAVQYMTPVFLLSDGYLANGAEPWLIPDPSKLDKFVVKHPTTHNDTDHFLPYKRNPDLVREWAIPGTPGLEHRVGGLEKRDITGDVCYEPDNHDHMIRLRRQKIDNIAKTVPPLEIYGNTNGGELLVLGWGSTYGPITSAVERCRSKGLDVSSAHLRYLDPMPQNSGEILKKFRRVLIPEMNLGQLRAHIRATFLIDAIGMNKVQGKPFTINEIETQIGSLLHQQNGRKS
ncbi:MAG: 2-oxoacid:acceptor oxidoreductase subunit alpha [Planctomycetes bacterium]|nr:2-oxoacid:acceptor oxidoreductase subunit alpha [Planctomycetota bacterium]MBI3832721.1 2-oxoacid:acceptor oxidoreductase subunit alpha [Planctomycetota bacterium]